MKVCVTLLKRCLDGSDFSVDGMLCSFHLMSAIRFVSPMYFSPQEHVPS